MLRRIGSVIGGLIAGSCVIALVEALSSKMYPMPPGLDPNDPHALLAFVATLPAGAFLMVLLAWTLGSLAGAWSAARIAADHRMRLGLIVGGLLLAGGISEMFMIPSPIWFDVAGAAVFLPAAWAGARIAGGGAKSASAVVEAS